MYEIAEYKTILRIVGRTWVEPNLDGLSQESRDVYRKRKRAIDLIIYEDATKTEAARAAGVTHQMINKLIKRCLTLDERENMYGYYGLIPYKKLSGNLYPANSIESIMQRNPDIYKAIIKLYFNKSSGPDKAPSKIRAFRKFKR